jgi:hypothetical protein
LIFFVYLIIYMNKVAVLSRYKEKDNFWHSKLINEGYKIVIYNKHEGGNLLPNVGRESHTYFKFIIDNYNGLPDEVLFSQYSPIDHFSDQKSVAFEDKMQIFLNKNVIDFCGIRPTDFDYFVRRRYVDWIGLSKELFPSFGEKEINQLLAFGSTLNGVFRVSKESILRRPISFYEKAFEMSARGIDPSEGYFFERMWKFIFMRTGCKNKEFESFNGKIFLFGESNKSERKVAGTFKNKLYNYGHIKLAEDGTISSNSGRSYYSHPNEGYWLLEDKNLFLIDNCGAVSSRFQINKESDSFLGDISDSSASGKWISNFLVLSKPFWQ